MPYVPENYTPPEGGFRTPSKHVRYDEKMRQQAQALRAQGLSYMKIAVRLGISKTTAAKFCNHKDAP